MKKIIFILLILVLSIVALYNYTIYNYLPLNHTEVPTSFGTFYYDDSQEDRMQVSILEIEKKYNYIREIYNLHEKKVNVSYHVRGDQKPFSNYGRSFYNGFTNSIVYYDDPTQSSVPIIHEYIHSQLGHFKELWFREGFTEYLYLKAVHSSEKLSPANTFDDQNYQRLNCDDARILCTEKLGDKFSKAYVLELLNDEIKPNSRENNGDIYSVGSMFCEYLINHIPEHSLISIINERKWHQFSIERLLRKKGVDVDIIRDEWIDENFK